MPLERLQKVMARAGIASRRACEELISAGRVEVNGEVVTQLGTKVDAQRDRITVDGAPLVFKEQPVRTYLMLYKPAGYLSVFDDERGRPGLEKLTPAGERLFSVGRLDLDSEGLLLLTNDGELAQVLSHPSHQHAKVYLALVDHRPGTDDLARLQRGIFLDGEKTAPSTWRVLTEPPTVYPPAEGQPTQGVWLKVVLREGRKRQIRRMAAAVGLDVRRLIRVQLGPLVLDKKLKPGESRRLTRDEVRRLHLSTHNAQQRRQRTARSAAPHGRSAVRRPVPSGRRGPDSPPRAERNTQRPAPSPARRGAPAPGPAPRPQPAGRERPGSPGPRGGERPAAPAGAPRGRPGGRQAPGSAPPQPRPRGPKPASGARPAGPPKRKR